MLQQSVFTIGYLPVTKQNWTNETLEGFRAQVLSYLSSLPGVRVIGGQQMIDSEERAFEELELFQREQPDLVIQHFMTFSLGVVTPLFAQRLGCPMVLWSMKEPAPNGGRLQSNSFCAANMNSHVLWRLHAPYFHIHAAPGSDEAREGLERAIRVTRAMNQLKTMRVGLIGGRVPGFYTSCCDERLLRAKLGTEVKIITEHEVIECAKSLPKEEVDKAMAVLLSDAKVHPTDGPEEDQLRKSAALFAAVQEMKKRFLVSTFAVRCWPEFIRSDLYGITVCSTLGHLTNHGITTACEGDVYGAMMMELGKTLSGELPFFCDMIVMEGELGVAWHCGAAPAKLCRPGCQPMLCHSATVEGGGVKGVTNEFPLKPGRVTLARLGERRDGDGFRMLVATGEAVETDLFVRGNPIQIRFDAGCERLKEVVIGQGWEHHYVMSYGDITQDLKDFCRILDIDYTLVQ